MENNYNNDELNKRVLEKLEKKISAYEFKNQENTNEKQSKKIVKMSFLKVASIAIVIGLLGGNVYTYATYNENMFSYILNKIGIFENYENNSKEVNITGENQVKSENCKLTLVSYGADKDMLVFKYKLELEEPMEFHKEVIDNVKIKNNDGVYGITDFLSSQRSVYEKISDTEYEFYNFYKIDSSKIEENSKILLYVNVYKELEEGIENILGTWNFEIDFEKNNLANEYKEYAFENKKAIFKNVETNKDEILNPYSDYSVKVLEMKQSDIGSKLVMYLNDYGTEPSLSYYVEILDENGNIILDDNLEFLIGGVPTEILFQKVDLTSTLVVNVYEKVEDKTLRKASITLDLEKDLKEKSIESSNEKEKYSWEDIEISYPANSEISKESYETGDNTRKALFVVLNNSIGNEEYVNSYINIYKYKNIYNRSLKELSEDLKNLEYLGGYGIRTDYSIYKEDGNDIENVSYEEMMNFAKNKKLSKNGKEVTTDEINIHEVKYYDEKNIKIDGVDGFKWTEEYGGVKDKYVFILDNNIYEIDCTSDFSNKEIIKEFIESIKINK